MSGRDLRFFAVVISPTSSLPSYCTWRYDRVDWALFVQTMEIPFLPAKDSLSRHFAFFLDATFAAAEACIPRSGKYCRSSTTPWLSWDYGQDNREKKKYLAS